MPLRSKRVLGPKLPLGKNFWRNKWVHDNENARSVATPGIWSTSGGYDRGLMGPWEKWNAVFNVTTMDPQFGAFQNTSIIRIFLVNVQWVGVLVASCHSAQWQSQRPYFVAFLPAPRQKLMCLSVITLACTKFWEENHKLPVEKMLKANWMNDEWYCMIRLNIPPNILQCFCCGMCFKLLL